MEVEQSYPPLPHNLNSQSTDTGADFQSLIHAMHRIALPFLTDKQPLPGVSANPA